MVFAMRAVGAGPKEIRKRIPYCLTLVGLENLSNVSCLFCVPFPTGPADILYLSEIDKILHLPMIHVKLPPVKGRNAEIEPTEGRVMVNGFSLRNIKEWQVPYLRRTVGLSK